MSRTLFWYILWDLLRIFLLASGVLAGIMSFGGLLRPLTEHGLSAAQVGRLLGYFSPAMTAYSYPVAALFATTIVYGRLSADNELTACRASGVSYLAMAAPALVLGLTVALISLLFLCFIVPVYNLKIEKVIYSNLAQLVQNEITRTHQVRLGPVVVSAQEAVVLPPDPKYPDEQLVQLTGPMFVSYDTPDPDNKKLKVASEYWMATTAVAHIKQNGDDVVELYAVLVNGTKFSRNVAGGQGKITIESGQYGPEMMPSPIREQAKFMNIITLHDILNNPQKSKRLQDDMQEAIAREERELLYAHVIDELNQRGSYRFVDGASSATIIRGDQAVGASFGGQLIVNSGASSDARQVKLTVVDADGTEHAQQARQVRLRAEPEVVAPGQTATSDQRHINLTFTGYDVEIQTEDEPAERKVFQNNFQVVTPAIIKTCETHTPEYYMTTQTIGVDRKQREDMKANYHRLLAKLQSEIHSRAAFAVSCVVLVMVGCALGMMFKSGNFLNAFAVSFIPALLGIALIVTGQQVAENSKSLTMGLGLIWTGNVLVSMLAIALLGRLHRH